MDKDRIAKLNVELINCTAEGELTAALAAKLCYSSSADIGALQEKISESEQKSFIEKIVSIGHHSVLEHVSFTFGIEGVSRTLTHQLVRHRIASYSQKSQRYVKHGSDFEYVLPETVGGFSDEYCEMMDKIGEFYDRMIQSGIPAEDARYILPNACETKIVMTMNARELIHFFALRCCERAQWEIRDMADKMLEICVSTAPAIFSKAGPGCAHGQCSEGKFTCGKAASIREKYRKLIEKSISE